MRPKQPTGGPRRVPDILFAGQRRRSAECRLLARLAADDADEADDEQMVVSSFDGATGDGRRAEKGKGKGEKKKRTPNPSVVVAADH